MCLKLCCLSFLDLRILITPLVSPNSSYFWLPRYHWNIVESGVINKQTIQVIMYVDTFKLTLLFLSVVSLCVWHQMTDNFQCQSHYCLFFQYHWTGLPREILQGGTRLLWGPGDKLRLHCGIINLFDERIVYSPDNDYVCSKRGTIEILWNCLLT